MPRTVAEYKQEVAERREEILRVFRANYPGHDIKRIEKAMDYAELLHKGQFRRNGRPYIFHPLAVTKLTADALLDENCLIAALLHDVLEDTVASRQTIADKFGPQIADMVQALTKIRTFSAERSEENKRLTYKRILMAAAKDIRPLIIKIFDRLTNMRDMVHMPDGHRRRVSAETLDVYVPFTRRLGMAQVERELTNLCLSYLYPEPYKEAEARIAKEIEPLKEDLQTTLDVIKKLLLEHGAQADLEIVLPVAADFYQPEVGVNSRADVVVCIQILIDEVVRLYTALGVIHSLFTPVPMAIRDMVANPMANGSRALETKVVIRGRIYQVSILTHEMQKVNEHGIVHNWKVNQNRLSGYYTTYMRLLEELVADEEMRVDDVLRQSHVEGIAVFSPRKDLYIMPHRSTALDFAYQVHREVGDRAARAFVNGIERPIGYVLNTGDVVQIVTSDKVHPEEKWLAIAVTSRARSAIKSYLRRQVDQRAVELGRDMLYAELEKYGRDPKVVTESEDFKKLLEKLDLTANELYRRVGFRKILPADFLHQHGIVPEEKIRKQKSAERASIRDKIFSSLTGKVESEGKWRFDRDDVFISYASCCNPIFGDKVVGVISEGKGITVHRDICPSLKTVPKLQRVEVEWNMDEKVDSAVLNLHISDQKGIVAKVLSVVSNNGLNMSEFNAYTVGHEAFLRIRLDVKSQRDLLRVVHDIRKMDAVLAITREE
ncbi:MAG: bifunctional (p)ppGpp synthetase/guanosine-3',5'-bis(diphosphate) 3'-pyrophosphohydrolase [Myxococcales bacterium]|nr:MAG: bifunctional (p)ppGpp synthetase/guanosine-3',5'-bis(diphosphate) 3'-pyrophosphohydrolase [Myxococcales bacterium]